MRQRTQNRDGSRAGRGARVALGAPAAAGVPLPRNLSHAASPYRLQHRRLPRPLLRCQRAPKSSRTCALVSSRSAPLMRAAARGTTRLRLRIGHTKLPRLSRVLLLHPRLSRRPSLSNSASTRQCGPVALPWDTLLRPSASVFTLRAARLPPSRRLPLPPYRRATPGLRFRLRTKLRNRRYPARRNPRTPTIGC